MKTFICLVWDLLHLIGISFVLLFPHETCITGILIGILWKRQINIARNIFLYILWWSLVSNTSYSVGIFCTLILLMSSPRVFHELFSNTLTVLCTWILNTIYPVLCRTQPKYPYSTEDNILITDHPTVTIILCNKNEPLSTLSQSIESIVSSKKYAEQHLNLDYIRLVLADGGSKNIEEISNGYDTIFDLILVVPGGKLCGRHEATMNETSDIIIAYDSDRKYDIQNTYEHLNPFITNWTKVKNGSNEIVLQVVGTTCYVNSDGVFPFNGGNSAYLREVYLKCPFNTTIDQTKTSSIWKEEELDWGNNLAKYGSVVSVKADYSDINPLPLIPFFKRMLNLQNSFMGGIDRWTSEETSFQVFCKIAFIVTCTVIISFSC